MLWISAGALLEVSASPDKSNSRIMTAANAMQFFDCPEDSPHPNLTSGMRSGELYRLKGVLGTGGAFPTVREGQVTLHQKFSRGQRMISEPICGVSE